MARTARLLLIAVCSTWTVSLASATTRYVAPSGTGTWAQSTSKTTPMPLATLEANYASFTAGDTYVFAAGSYTLAAGQQIQPTVNGTSASPITLTGGDTTVTGASGTVSIVDANLAANECFYLNGVSWYVVNGFTAKSALLGGGFPTGSNIALSGATSCTVSNCDSSNGYSCCILAGSTSCRITGCRLHGATGTGGGGGCGTAFWNGTSSGNIFDHNLYYNNQLEGHYDANLSTGTASKSLIFNNVFYSNELNGTPRNGELYVNTSGTTLRNNICWNVSASSSAAHAALSVGASATATISEKFDDLYAPAAGAILVNWNGTTYTTLASYQTGTSQGSNDLSADPLFVSTSGSDFHLLSTYGYVNNAGTWQTGASNSPCIDAGDNGTSTIVNMPPSGIPAGVATITVNSTVGFPAQGLIIVEGDSIAYTGTTATTFTGCTGALAHANGVTVYSAYSDWSQEVQDHGSRINMGAEGDTNNASRSGALANNTWTGAFDTKWSNGGNWYHMTPTNTNDLYGNAVIASAANNPALDTAGVCYSLSVSTGTLNLSDSTARTLAIGGGNMSITATGTVAVSGTSSTTISGSVTNSGTVSQSGGTVVFTGAFTNSSTYNQTAGMLQFAGSSSQTFTVNTAPTLSGTLSVNVGTGATLSLGGTAGTLTATTLSLESTNSGSFEITPASGPAVTVSGTTTVSGGTLLFDQSGATTSLSGAVTVAGGTFDARTGTVKLGSSGLTVANAATFNSGSAGTMTLTSTDTVTPTRYPIYVKGTANISEITVNYAVGLQFGTDSAIATNTNIQAANDGDTVSATINSLDEVAFNNSTHGILFRNLTNATSQSNPLYVYSGSFDSSVAWNILLDPSSPAPNWPYYVTVQNGLGAKGANTNPPNSGATPSGEDWDSDPGDGNAAINGGKGYVLWNYFNWRWNGSISTAWNNASNWTWEGSGAAPEAYPGATNPLNNPNTDTVVAQKRSLWIPSAASGCVEDQSYNIEDLSVTSGGSLTMGAMTLGIYGNAFKSSASGVFNMGTGTVSFAGTNSQVVVIIGSSSSFYNLDISKTGGSTATLGSSVTAANNTTVTSGTFSTSLYTLTANGALTISAGATLSVTSGGAINRTGAPSTSLTNNGTLTLSGSGTVDWSPGTGVVTGATGNAFTLTGTSALTLGAGTNTLAGTATLTGGVSVFVPDAGSISLKGTLAASASGGSTPSITKTAAGSGGFSFSAIGGSTLNVSALNFSYAGLNGFTIDDSGASAVTLTALNNVSFANVVGTPTATNPGGRRRHLYFKGTTGAASVTLSGLSFDNTFLNGGTNDGYNVVTEWPNSVTITFSQWGGPGAGSSPDRDYDNSESASLAIVKWARSLTWTGKEKYRQGLTVTANAGAGGIPVNGWVSVSFNHATLVTGGKSLASGDDIRIVYEPPGVAATEVPRVIYNPLHSAASGWNQTGTTLEFQAQAAIGVSGSDSNYYLYYGATAADAANPPLPANGINAGLKANGTQLPNSNVYGILLFYDGFESGASIDTTLWPTRDVDTNNTLTPIPVPTGTAGTSGTAGSNCAYIGQGNTTTPCYIQSKDLTTTTLTNVTIFAARAETQSFVGGGDTLDTVTVEARSSSTLIETCNSATNTTAAGVQWAAVTIAPTSATGGAATANTTNATSGLATLEVRISTNRDKTTEYAYADEVYVVAFNTLHANFASSSLVAQTAMNGNWSDPYNWQVGGSSTQFATPTNTDDATINGGTNQPTLDVAGSCLSLSLGSSAPSTLGTGAFNLTLAGGVTIGTLGTLNIAAGGTVTHGPTMANAVTVNGTVTINGGGSLSLASLSTLNIASGGTLSTAGSTSSSRATISGSGAYAFTLGGTASVNWLTISNLNASGVQVQSTATLTGWAGVTLSSGAAGGVYLDLSSATSATTLPSTMTFCTFNTGPTNNVKGAGTGATHTKVTFLNWAGALGGRANTTNDPLDLIVWGSGAAVVNVNQSKTYATIYDALAATVSGDVVEARDNAIRTESIDITTLSNKVFTLDGAVMQAPSGTFAVKGTGVATNEILQNCVFISNGAAVIQNPGRMYHCDVLGTDATLLSVAAANTTTIQNCIVGNATSWTGAHNPVSNSGTFTGTYCDFDASLAGAPYNGTGNVNGSPTFVNYAPTSGMYDVHLNTGSPCIDAANAAPGPVTTTFDRGSDFENPAANQRRPVYPTAVAPAHPYDMGAEEYAPYLAGATPYGVPYWKKQTGPSSGGTPNVNSDLVPDLDFANFVFFTGSNVNTSASAAGNQDLLALYMGDGTGAGGTTRATFTTGAQYSKARKVVHITVTRDAGGATDSVYCVVNTDNVGSDGDGIIALTYNGTSFSVKSGWSTTTPALMTTGSGMMGSVVVDGNGDLFVVKGKLLYHLSGSTGSGYTTATTPNYWASDGHNNWYTVAGSGTTDAIYDPNGGMVADRVNNIVQVPLAGHPTDQIWRINRDSGVIANNKDTGTQAGYRKNHTGFNEIGGRVYLTPTQTDFVVALGATNLNPVSTWVSGPATGDSVDLGANVTSRAATLTRNDADVRVAAGNQIFKLLKSTGQLASDSAAGTDWGNSRSLRGNVSTTPFMVGFKSLAGVAGDDSTDDKGSKLFFGTDQGYCYVLSYIRNTTGNAAGDIIGDSQPTWSTDTSTYLALDGRPYPGYPYRLPGVKVVQVTQGFSSSISRNLLVFVCDNGWIYAFPEPY